MPQSAERPSLASLRDALAQLHAATESLNGALKSLEDSLLGLNPGIALWSLPPIRLNADTGGMAHGSQLGFQKVDDRWGLFVRRGMFVRAQKSGGWVPMGSQKWEVIHVQDASRDERAAAAAAFDGLVEALTTAAKEKLSAIEAAQTHRR